MPTRLKDIAQDLGVSVVTVSKVLRNHRDISQETRDRVLKRVKELGYRPNLAARALVTGRSHAIGLVVPDLVHSFFGQVAKSMSGVLRQKGYGLLISSSEEDELLEQTEIDQLLSRRVDALVVASTQQHLEGFERLQGQDTPFILIDRRVEGIHANFIGVDDEEVGRLATRHLVEQGCRRIAHLPGSQVSTGIGRLAGYRRALREAGLDHAGAVATLPGGSDGDIRGFQMMKELLRANLPPDGVFCFNDPTAAGAIEAILEHGLRVPEDIAVVGCGNVRYAHMLRVPLSSVDQDSAGLGECVARTALNLIESDSPAVPRTTLLQPRLIVRASSRRKKE